MTSLALFAILGVVGLFGRTQAAATNKYCAAQAQLCKPGETHIACSSTSFGKKCPKVKNIIKMDSAIKDMILKVHNTFRNDIAGGKIKGYKGATRMATMQWDPELATFAEYNSMRCEFEHDECHNTEQFKSSGQNIGQVWMSGAGQPSDKDTMQDIIDTWFDEHKIANMDIINKYPRNWSGDDIGHFTAIVQQASIRVGCGAMKMIDSENDNMDSTFMACNYASTNWIDKPVYEAGSPASECKTGTNPEFKNLCSIKEKY